MNLATILNALPKPLILAMALALGLGWAWTGVRLENAAKAALVAQAAASQAKAESSDIRRQAEHLVADAASAAQQESDRRWSAQLEIVNHAKQTELAAAEAAASGAAASAAGLRQQLAQLSARAAAADRQAGNNPAAAASCHAVATLSDELGECAGAYSDMAKQADANLIAGLICERSYAALRPGL